MSKKTKMSLRELDYSNAGSWPLEYKIFACIFAGALVFVLLWALMTRPKGEELEDLERREMTLRTDFETKQGRAANLEPLKQQLAQMEQQLQQMLRQLPSRTEMPALINDISQTALATGIHNELFKPGPESPMEFYAEKPIDLKMVGTYHQFGAFVSAVASLPRVVIMTMHDISIRPRTLPVPGRIGGITPNTTLELMGTVKTYRYLDEEEAEGMAAAGGAH